MTGLRNGLSLAWMFMVAAELIAATRGLGYLLTDGRETGRADLVLAAILLLALLGKASDSAMPGWSSAPCAGATPGRRGGRRAPHCSTCTCKQAPTAAATILTEIQLQVAVGETLALVGASGCGKSSLLRIASGLDRAYTGQVTLAGQPVTRPTRDIRFIFQEPRLFPWLTVAQNIAFDEAGRRPHQAGRGAARRSRPERPGETPAQGPVWRPGPAGGHRPGSVTRPRVLLLDEPFSAVTPSPGCGCRIAAPGHTGPRHHHPHRDA
jgi:hypothetical protein